MNEGDEWLDPETIEDHSNSRGHDATVQLFDNDRKMVVFYEGNLYLTELSEGEFSKKELLSMINSKNTFESHCFINDTQDIIYFSSDRNDPGGDLDLFVVKKNSNDTWGEPMALDELNTRFDEDSPFVSEDGILYFNSRSSKSMGGYDIFYSTYNESKKFWRAPTNIGYPINSVADDTYFSTFGKMAYLSSSRADGFGSLDLYRIQLFDHVLIPGKVVNKANDQLVAAADIRITYNGHQLETTSDDEGGLELTVPIEKEFEIEILKDQQLLHRGSYFINVHLSNLAEKKYNLMVHMKPAASKPVDSYPLKEERQQLVVRMKETGETRISHFEQHHVDLEHALALPVNIAVEPSITMEPSMAVVEEKVDLNLLSIYFDLDSYVIDDDARPSMDMVVQAMSSQPDLKLVIEAHADSRGSKSYNMKLTQRRAQSVLDYLASQGIEKSRLEARAYGEAGLLNKCDNCTEEKHRDNRRPTFQVAQNLENPGQLVLKNQ